MCILHTVYYIILYIYIDSYKKEEEARKRVSLSSTKIDDRAKRMAIGSHLYNIIY